MNSTKTSNFKASTRSIFNLFKSKSLETTFLILLFVFSIRIWKPSFVFLALAIITLIVTIKNKRIRINADSIVLFLAFFSYLITDLFNRNDFSLSYILSQGFHLISIPVFYWIGLTILDVVPVNRSVAIYKNSLYIAASGTALYGILSVLKKVMFPDLYAAAYLSSRYADNGLDSEHAIRSVLDIWNNKIIYATELNTQFLFVIALFPAIFFIKDHLKRSILLAISMILVIWAGVETASRTNILMIVITILLGFAIAVDQFLLNKNNPIKIVRSLIQKYWLFLTVLIVGIISSLYFLIQSANGFQLQRIMLIRPENIVNDGRWPVAMAVIKNIPKQPFGNMDMYWAHNLWLDVARVAGIIPMVILIIFTIMTFIRGTSFIRTYRKSDPDMMALTFGVLVVLNISFFLEPVIEASPQNFMIYALLMGMIASFQLKRNQIGEYIQERK